MLMVVTLKICETLQSPNVALPFILYGTCHVISIVLILKQCCAVTVLWTALIGQT